MFDPLKLRPAKLEFLTSEAKNKRELIELRRLILSWNHENNIKTLNSPTQYSRPYDIIRLITYLFNIGKADCLKYLRFSIYLQEDTDGPKVVWKPYIDLNRGICEDIEWQHGGYGRRRHLTIVIPFNHNLPVDVWLEDGTVLTNFDSGRIIRQYQNYNDPPSGLLDREEEYKQLISAFKFRSYQINKRFVGF